MENQIFQPIEYGKIILKLKPYMDKKNITRNKLATLTGLKFETVSKYYFRL